MRRGWVAVPLLAVLAVAPARALAHAELASSSPEQGAIVADPVGVVTLTFSEAVEPTATGYRVTLPDGTDIVPAATSADGAKWDLAFDPVDAGAVAVGYDVISLDGHPIVGELTFTVAAAPGGTAGTATVAPAITAAPVAVAPPPTVAADAQVTTDAPAEEEGGASPLLWTIVLVGGAVLVGVVAWTTVRRRQP